MNHETVTGCEKTFASLAYPEFDGGKDCPVSWVLALMELVSGLSCGGDTLCREGSLQLRVILGDVSVGKGRDGDGELMRELFDIIRENANCDMARTAAEKCLSLMNAYSDVWERHIYGKRCPASVCAIAGGTAAPAPAGGFGDAGPGRRRRRRV
jgi:NADH:ubiquinone oxidoreductase subunit F (NADH-binding)